MKLNFTTCGHNIIGCIRNRLGQKLGITSHICYSPWASPSPISLTKVVCRGWGKGHSLMWSLRMFFPLESLVSRAMTSNSPVLCSADIGCWFPRQVTLWSYLLAQEWSQEAVIILTFDSPGKLLYMEIHGVLFSCWTPEWGTGAATNLKNNTSFCFNYQ